MKVKDCMTEKVVTVKRSTTLTELIGLFRKYNFHTLPVVEVDNKIVGIITFEDIFKVFQPYSQEVARMLEATPLMERMEEEDILLADISSEMGMLIIVDDLVNTRFVTVSQDSSIEEARALMKLHHLPRLLVIKDKGFLKGIISLFDIILAVFKEKGVIK
ncbi:MAG: CBS domain-containing protein [Candidatus Omnitrophota bacterium]|nr:CBS domain-containing protein [Candidatus Omnitrophota bacterium]